MSCIEIFTELSDIVNDINNEFIDKFTDKTTEYMLSCVKTDITYDNYYKLLKQQWDKKFNEFLNKTRQCSSMMNTIQSASKVLTAKTTEQQEDVIIDEIMKYIFSTKQTYETSNDVKKTFEQIIQLFIQNCSCQMIDIFKVIIDKYQSKYIQPVNVHGRQLLKQHYDSFKKLMTSLQNINFAQTLPTLQSQLKLIYSFSIEDELNKLIPNELGSLKQFFIKVISAYYNNLHPIIWAQMYDQIVKNIFIDLPFSSEELFQFASKQILLNSGPFILKILQMKIGRAHV